MEEIASNPDCCSCFPISDIWRVTNTEQKGQRQVSNAQNAVA